MKVSVYYSWDILGSEKPHPQAQLETYRYKNKITGKVERAERWVLTINSVMELEQLAKNFGSFILMPSLEPLDNLYMLVIYGKEKPTNLPE